MEDSYINQTNPFEKISKPVMIIVFILFLAAIIIVFSNHIGFQTAKIIQNARSENIHNVRLTDDGFNPSILYAQVGDFVLWENLASMPHTIASNYWTSELLFPGEEFLLIINDFNEYEYFSINNKSLSGKIVVTP